MTIPGPEIYKPAEKGAQILPPFKGSSNSLATPRREVLAHNFRSGVSGILTRCDL